MTSNALAEAVNLDTAELLRRRPRRQLVASVSKALSRLTPRTRAKSTTGIVRSLNARSRRHPYSLMTASWGMRTVSRMTSSGMPNICPPASTVMTLVIMTLNGKSSRTLVPWPRRLSIETRPPTRSTAERTASRPTPRPRELGNLRGGRKPRREYEIENVRLRHDSQNLIRHYPTFFCDFPNAIDIDTAAIVAHLDANPGSPLPRSQKRIPQDRDLWLAARQALSRGPRLPWSRALRTTCSNGSNNISMIALSASSAVALDSQAHGLAETCGHLAYNSEEIKLGIRNPTATHAHSENRFLQFNHQPLGVQRGDSSRGWQPNPGSPAPGRQHDLSSSWQL